MGWGYIAWMHIDPIMLGWLGSLVVLILWDSWRGK